MRPLRILLAIPLLAALAACGDATTAPTDRDLLGTWTIEPTPALLPDGGVRQMTVQFGPDGGYMLETATFAPGVAPQPVQYGKSFGSVTSRGGSLQFHPSGALSLGMVSAAAGDPGPDPLTGRLRQPVTYEVVGDQLVLHLGTTNVPPVVLTRRR